MLCATLLCPLLAVAGGSEATPRVISTLTTTLDELGYPRGITFDDTTAPSERTLLFYIPKEMQINSATLRIVYTSSSQTTRNAFLSVSINDLPQRKMPLKADSITREWLVPVPKSALKGGQLKITVRGYIPVNYGHIVDGQPQSGFARISADSSLVTHQEGLPETLRDAWLTLPEKVVVAIPGGTLDETTFKAALDWITLLMRNHHEVKITTLPELGDVVIAPEAGIAAAVTHYSGLALAGSPWGEPRSNLGVMNVNNRSFIAVTQPWPDVRQFALRWQVLSHHEQIETNAPDEEEVPDKVLLNALGMSSATALVGHKLQWSATITPWNLPPGTRPHVAKVHLVMPHSGSNKPYRVFIYLNDMLVSSKRFTGDGAGRQFSVAFDSVPRSESYQMRVVLRDSGDKDHIEPDFLYPVRMTPQSHIVVRRDAQPPAGLSSVPTALGNGFVLYVPSDYLSAAPRFLPLLARVLVGFVVPRADYRLIVVSNGHVPRPRGNFIVAGDMPLGEMTLPVRFDEGKVQLVDYRGEILIEERRLRMNNVIQLMKRGAMTGLWFHPGETADMPVIDVSRLASDDVAIYEADKLALSFDSQQEDLAYLQYLESPRWFERLYSQRIFWIVLAWLLLTAGIVYLFVKSKQHRIARS